MKDPTAAWLDRRDAYRSHTFHDRRRFRYGRYTVEPADTPPERKEIPLSPRRSGGCSASWRWRSNDDAPDRSRSIDHRPALCQKSTTSKAPAGQATSWEYASMLSLSLNKSKLKEAILGPGMWKGRLAAKFFPWHIGLLDKVNHNALVWRWIEEQRDRIPTFENRYDFYRYVHGQVCGGAPIDFLGFGVYKGDSIRFWSQMNRDPHSRFIGFDSFEGLPENWNKKLTKGSFFVGGAVPQIDDERVSFVKGWFQNTLPSFLGSFTPRSRLVVNNDSDLYSSTLFTLVSLHKFLVPGTVIIFDEYSSATHEFRAFADYKSACWRSAHALAMASHYAMQVAFVFD